MTGANPSNSVWIRPADAIADRKRWNVIFPTKLNLMKLSVTDRVDAALVAARAAPPLTVTPWVEQSEKGPVLRIRDDAGYEQTSALLKEAL